MVWRINDPQCHEADKIKYLVVPYTRGKGLDIGCGPNKAFPHFIGVDNYADTRLFGIGMKPDIYVEDATNLDIFQNESMNFVFSSHTLEHIEDHQKALKEWWRVIKPEGYLVLYLPHKDLYPNIGTEGANPDHKHDFLPDDIIQVMREIGGFDLIINESRNTDNGEGQPGNEYSFLQVYRKRKDKEIRFKDKQPSRTAFVIRYGGFGDMIQASSILPGLKKMGYHVIFNTTEKGKDILKNDPNIDEFYLQDTDQVPNNELGLYWGALRKRFTKFINLSESVEGTLLSLPGRVDSFWGDEARRLKNNVNYIEMTHAIAEVPMPCHSRFYATDEERKWAREQGKKIKGPKILYSLSGSSVHKSWPHMDMLLARILTIYPDATIVLTGDHLCKILEQGWENEERIWKRAGEWTIRETLTFACYEADLVIGPETGVLNAAGMEEVAKIVCLSHSSHENLCKHWVNTISLKPMGTKCYPCHRMHYNFDNCIRHESGTAYCQWDISIEQMWEAVQTFLKKKAA